MLLWIFLDTNYDKCAILVNSDLDEIFISRGVASKNIASYKTQIVVMLDLRHSIPILNRINRRNSMLMLE